MARAQSQFLRIFAGSTTYHRWQNYYGAPTVSLDGEDWSYVDFTADGFVAGDAGQGAEASIEIPATDENITIVSDCLRLALLVQVDLYEFDSLLGDNAPQAGQVLLESYIGEVVDAKATLTSATMSLGSSVAPIGSQYPPRKFTSRLIGVPCKL